LAYTLEDERREDKVMHETRIPAGTYKITAPISFAQNASGNFRREIVGGNGTMAVAKILVAYHGYGSNLVSGNDKGAFFFGPATGSGNTNEFSISGFHFEGVSGGFKHPPAIECKGAAQSRFNNIVITKLENSGLSISSPQNCKFFNVSVWECGRSFTYKDTGIKDTSSGIAKVIVDQAQNSNDVIVDTTLSSGTVNIGDSSQTVSSDTPFTATDKFKTIALWSSSPTNQFRQKCKITNVDSSSQVTVNITQPDTTLGNLTNKNLIFGSPHITTQSNSTTITADANTFTVDDVGAYIWLRVANPTTITAWSASTDYDTVGTLVKNNGRIYRLLADIGTGKLQPTHAKTKKDIDAWAASTAYTTDDLVINAGNIYKAIVDIASGVAAPTHTTPSTNASPGDQDVNGWEYVPWDEMRIGLYRRKITSFTSVTEVILDAAIGATTTTANGTGTENITCEIAVPAIDINSDHGAGNSSDNKFINLQVESHKGVGICAEDQSLLDFATTKIHSEQGSNALLSSAIKYSIAALWLHQVDGTYNGSTDGQYIGDNRVYVSAQSASFILSDFITRTANHEKIIAIDEKNGFFDGASLIIDNLSITGGVSTHKATDVVDDLTGFPYGHLMSGAFSNQGSDVNGKLIGYITQNAYVENVGTTAKAPKLFIEAANRQYSILSHGGSGTNRFTIRDETSGNDRLYLYSSGHFGAASDNAQDLGISSARWDDIFATNGTIQTSDENEKQDIRNATDAEKKVAVALKSLFKMFRFKDAVAAKGDNARLHFGVIAQNVETAFKNEGLDPEKYALFCKDTWTDETTGKEVTRLGIRYSELLAFVISSL